MTTRVRHLISGMLLTAVVLTAACSHDKAAIADQDIDPETVPTVTSHDVQTIISDNGITRYRITTPLWLIYEEAKEPHWIFPKGVLAEELDSAYNNASTIRCDSAYFFERKQLWHLTGNVRMTNVNGDVILTNEIFWDQQKHQLYSESFIHIEKQERVIEGRGYVSNENFTTYTLRNVEAIFPIDEEQLGMATGEPAPEAGAPAAQAASGDPGTAPQAAP